MDASLLRESYKPHDYRADSEIPFGPDGNSSFISGYIERVKGTSAPFLGLKCARKNIIVEADPVSSGNTKRRLMQEAKILYYSRHPHVIRLIHSYFVDEGEEHIKFAVVMDLADGNLHQYLRPGKIPSSQWFGCLLGVVRHIHGLGIRHRDIKPSNILIKDNTVLLADFGISQMGLGKTVPTTNLKRSSERSREYCAPEVDKGSTRGRSADIFSLGAVFLEMLLSHAYPDGHKELADVLKPSPQETSSYAKHIEEVQKWTSERLHPVGWPAVVLSICQAMLHPDRSLRPLAEELDLIWSSICCSDKRRTCSCAGDMSIVEPDKLRYACRWGTEGEVERLLDNGMDPNTMGAIHHAAERGSKAIVQILLNKNANVDSTNPVGQTALHCASRNGFDTVVELLLENDANVNAEDENGQTALHAATAQGYVNIAKMLLKAGADAYSEDLDGDTAFHFADRNHHFDLLELLENCT